MLCGAVGTMDGREIDESRLNENRVEVETLGQTSQSGRNHACGWMATARASPCARHAGWLVGDFLASSACLLALVFVGVRVVFGGLFYPFGLAT